MDTLIGNVDSICKRLSDAGSIPAESTHKRMDVIFLDIDGVVNNEETAKNNRGMLGIDPYLAFLVGRISLALPDVKFVLSSSWRCFPKGREQVEEQVVPILGVTPILDIYGKVRGDEIKAWLDSHPEVERYAILDDYDDMLPEQLPNLFRTTWQTGITPEIVQKVCDHFS